MKLFKSLSLLILVIVVCAGVSTARPTVTSAGTPLTNGGTPSYAELQAQIAALLAQIAQLQGQSHQSVYTARLAITSPVPAQGSVDVQLSLPKQYDGDYVVYIVNPVAVSTPVSSGTLIGLNYYMHGQDGGTFGAHLGLSSAHQSVATNPGGLHWFPLPSGRYKITAVVYPENPFKPGTEMEYKSVGTGGIIAIPGALTIINSPDFDLVNGSSPEISSPIRIDKTMSVAPVLQVNNPDDPSDDKGIFTVKFDVTPGNDDVYINKNALRDSTEFGGADYTVKDANGVDVLTGAVTASLTSNADTEGTRYKVNQGESKTFTLTVNYNPTVSGFYQVALKGLGYSVTNSNPIQFQTVFPAEDFQTDSISITDGGGAQQPSLSYSVFVKAGSDGDSWLEGTDIDGLVIRIKNTSATTQSITFPTNCWYTYRIYNKVTGSQVFDLASVQHCSLPSNWKGTTFTLYPGWSKDIPFSHPDRTFHVPPGQYLMKVDVSSVFPVREAVQLNFNVATNRSSQPASAAIEPSSLRPTSNSFSIVGSATNVQNVTVYIIPRKSAYRDYALVAGSYGKDNIYRAIAAVTTEGWQARFMNTNIIGAGGEGFMVLVYDTSSHALLTTGILDADTTPVSTTVSATIDQSSLTTTSMAPTIYGRFTGSPTLNLIVTDSQGVSRFVLQDGDSRLKKSITPCVGCTGGGWTADLIQTGGTPLSTGRYTVTLSDMTNRTNPIALTTGTLVINADTTQTATIDQNSLSISTDKDLVLPVITGTAKNVLLLALTVSDQNGKVAASPYVSVTGGHWSAQVSQSLPPGTYTVVATAASGKALVTGTLTITRNSTPIVAKPTGSVSASGCSVSTPGGTCAVKVDFSSQNSLLTPGVYRETINVVDLMTGKFYGGTAVTGVSQYEKNDAPSGSWTFNLKMGTYKIQLYGWANGNYVLLDEKQITAAANYPTPLPSGQLTVTPCTIYIPMGSCGVATSWTSQNSFQGESNPYTVVNIVDLANNGIYGGTWVQGTSQYHQDGQANGSWTFNLKPGSYSIQLYGLKDGNYVLLEQKQVTIVIGTRDASQQPSQPINTTREMGGLLGGQSGAVMNGLLRALQQLSALLHH